MNVNDLINQLQACTDMSAKIRCVGGGDEIQYVGYAKDNTVLLSDSKARGSCNECGGTVFEERSADFEAFCPDCYDDLWEGDFTPNDEQEKA